MQMNNTPEVGTHTKAELAQFINKDAANLIGFCCERNPTTVYEWITMNYPMFGRFGNQGWTTDIGKENMNDFLVVQYNALTSNQKSAFLSSLAWSLPDAEEVPSWATPKAS